MKMLKQAKRVKCKKEIWPYPEGTVLVSYGGGTPEIYYVEDNEMPNGKGLNVQWFMVKGNEYYEQYFEDLPSVDFRDTIWAVKLAESLKNRKDMLEHQIEQEKKKYDAQMKSLKNALHITGQEWVDNFGTDINAEVVTVEEEVQQPSYISANAYYNAGDHWGTGTV